MTTRTANGIEGATLAQHSHLRLRAPTTLILDTDLLSKARAYTGIHQTSALVHRALKYLVELEASRQLARLHGIAPGLADTPGRQPEQIDDAR